MTIDQAAHKQDRTLKLTVFGIIVFLFLVCIAAIALIWPIVQKTAFAYDMMNLHRTYAHLLYRANDWQEGDQQITIAIQACSNPPANLSEADALTHLYQERAWEAFQRHLKDPSQPAGAEDQEHSVEVADKAFGPDHEQTIYKIPTLALIYADIGEKDKADKLMQRAIDAVDHKASAKECAWFVYACDARLKASAKEYQAALKSFNHAFSVAADDGQKSHFVLKPLMKSSKMPVVKDPDLKNAHSLLGREKFDELEKIADKLQKAETPLATAAWKLDSFY